MKKNPAEPELSSLMATSPAGMPDEEVMQLIGRIIDLGGDEASQAALDQAWSMLDKFQAGDMAKRHHSRAHYFRANIWNARRRSSPDRQAWHWKSNAIDGEILELRRALVHPGFKNLRKIEQAQLFHEP